MRSRGDIPRRGHSSILVVGLGHFWVSSRRSSVRCQSSSADFQEAGVSLWNGRGKSGCSLHVERSGETRREFGVLRLAEAQRNDLTASGRY